jgi:hypothetical protein
MGRLRRLVREFGPVFGVGRRALHRHPIWTDGAAEGGGAGVVVVPGFARPVLRGHPECQNRS